MLYKWDIIGHQIQLKQLEHEISDNNITHAYLFSGPKQTGKFSIAKIFTNILLCKKNFCHICEDCKLLKNGAHPDAITLDDNGESIKIDTIRELIRKTNLTIQGKYRIILIENIERMPIEAQNSFLKTLEEPPGETIFILTTSHINQVLPTILSRVRQYFFFTVEDNILEKYLKQNFDNQNTIKEAVNMAQGRPGLAITLMEDQAFLGSQRELYTQIDSFLKKNDLVRKFIFIEMIEKNPEQIELFFDAFTRYLRKLIFEYTTDNNHPLKSRFTLQEIVNLFEYLEKTRYLIQRNINKKLALENLLLQTEK